MKKTLLLLFVTALITSSVNAQNISSPLIQSGGYKTDSSTQSDNLGDINMMVRPNNFGIQSLQREINENDINYRWDGYTTIGFDENNLIYKRSQSFDENGSYTLYLTYDWDTENQIFVPNIKDEATNDISGNQTLHIRYNWDIETQSYIPNNKSERTWDENGNMAQYIGYNWDASTQAFVPYSRYDYDENGNVILNIEFSWDASTQASIPSNRWEYSYNENGNQTLFIFYSWDASTQALVPSEKQESYYDENANQILLLYYNWDTSIQNFVPTLKDEYYYDENGNQISLITYFWDTSTQTFIPSSKTELSWDGNGNQTSSTSFTWDTVSQSWFVAYGNRMLEYSYDANGNIILFIENEWEPSIGYFPVLQQEYAYDEIGNQTLYIDYIFDYNIFQDSGGIQFLVPDTKEERTWDENGNQTLHTSFQWLQDQQIWVATQSIVQAYDENGNQTLYERYGISVATDLLVLVDKWEKSFDENGNRTSYITYESNNDTQTFDVSYRDLRTFNQNPSPVINLNQWKIEKYYNLLGVFKPSFKKDYSIHSETSDELVIVGTTSQYDTNFNTWEEFAEEEFKSYWYYTKTSTLSTENAVDSTFLLYPNPTGGVLNIKDQEILNIEIYNNLGQLLLRKNNSNSVDVSSLSKGVYLIKVSDGINASTKKFIKN